VCSDALHVRHLGADYGAMLEAQGGGCAICGRKDSGNPRTTALHVDHDHMCCPGQRSCGKCIQGILCHVCNIQMTWFDLRGPAALAYSQKP
jgi:hypothetical protein